MSSTPPPAAPQPAAPLSEAEDRQWASFAHLGGILSVIPSLIIFLVFKDRGRFVAQESKEALNFQITLAIVQVANFIIGSILTLVTFGLWAFIQGLIAFALFVIAVIFSIIGFTKAKDGIAYRYPFAIRLVK
ncbi:MAG: DUF4870 domain-containing protein [Microbacteriaceae bacterium]